MAETQQMPAVQEPSGSTNKILVYLLFLLIGGGAAGGGLTIFNGKTVDEISKQIQLESPYVEDRPLVRRLMNSDIPEMKQDIKDIKKMMQERR